MLWKTFFHIGQNATFSFSVSKLKFVVSTRLELQPLFGTLLIGLDGFP
jgi:hypothetical protein